MVSRGSVSRAHGLPPKRHRCTVCVLAGTHQCATESRMTLWQNANPVRAVGASPVILSPTANVFVGLSSVIVFRTVKLRFSHTKCDSCVLWNVGILTHLLDDKRCTASSLSFPTVSLLSSMSLLTCGTFGIVSVDSSTQACCAATSVVARV